MTDHDLPHECPHCGERFGWGPEAAFLTFASSVPFNEPAPCCGERLIGYFSRDEGMVLEDSER